MDTLRVCSERLKSSHRVCSIPIPNGSEGTSSHGMPSPELKSHTFLEGPESRMTNFQEPQRMTRDGEEEDSPFDGVGPVPARFTSDTCAKNEGQDESSRN